MKFLLQFLIITLAVCLAQACRDNTCSAFCAGEIRDPSKKLTFYSEESLAAFNENFDGDEKFIYLSKGQCKYDDNCYQIPETEICAIPEPGASGYPQTFRNFCDLNLYNCDNQQNEYLYYHDGCCNALDDATPSTDDCDCLDCDDSWKSVCAFPEVPVAAQPITFSNYCWLKNYNCLNPDDEFFYWHEGACYSDEN